MAPRCIKLLLVLLAILLPGPVSAQEEVSSGYYRYRDRETSTGYYEDYEVKPRGSSPFIEAPGVTRKGMRYSADSSYAWSRKYLSDSHAGIPFYERRRCESCHSDQVRNLHTVRAGITCRQCHSSEPIASINHYFSRLNPIRRHAYTCAKCHEGASASFATFVVHTPPPAAAGTAQVFPGLYYSYMALEILTLITLAIFIPHAILWGFRELVAARRRRREGHHG